MTVADVVMEGTHEVEAKMTSKWTVHGTLVDVYFLWPVSAELGTVEVRLKPRAAARFDSVRNSVHTYLKTFERIGIPSSLDGWQDVPELVSSVDKISVSESACPSHTLALEDTVLQIHVYQPSDSDSFEEFSNSTGVRDDDDDTMAASVCELPNSTWEGLWDSLIYADDIKLKLLDYIHATLVLSDANVDFNLVSWNRVVLLHGPPGTGKTSLCRALAQKLSIRLSHRYSHARLLEINSHSLFSKWFSESGKLVQRLFNSITELVDEEDAFLVVLIDEVESLTAARAGAMAGTEPSDGLRVVNALLTQLDRLKHRKNVLIMSTSNLVKAIGITTFFKASAPADQLHMTDSAFVDRADIVQYVDLPSRDAIYEILRTSHIFEATAKATSSSVLTSNDDPHSKSKSVALRLLALAAQCRAHSLSGRALRRLPVLALARYIGIGNVYNFSAGSNASASSKAPGANSHGGADVDAWLDGMEKVVRDQTKELQRLN
ncbi:hypothetical protein C0995_000885 [Termitomyces sp. Mi166|nr:hypothetical protein C0995_000885 [Termitomyces sp. Mi166\